MTKRIDRVLAYGCSWTAGNELMDHVHMGVSFDRCNDIKTAFIINGWSMEKMQQFIEKFNINDKFLIELNKRSSWAGQLAKLLNKPFENRAESGSSLDKIYFSLHNDYINGKILPTDLVLIGLTTVHRKIRFCPQNIDTLHLGRWVEITDNNRSLVELFNDDYLIFSYFKTLALIGNMKSKINIRLQPMIKELNPHEETFLFDLSHTRDYAKYTWDNLQDVFMLPDEYLQLHIVDGKPKRCGFMHESVESHIELAEKIYSSVISNTDIKL